MLDQKIYQNMREIPNEIPSTLHCSDLLQIAFMYIKHDIAKCRQNYGQYTYGEWYELFRKYKINMTRYPFKVLIFISDKAKKPTIQEFFKEKQPMIKFGKAAVKERNLPRVEYYKSVAGIWKRL